MSSPGSVSNWLRTLHAGEEAALGRLSERYLPRLVRLAASCLGGLPRRVADQEDVAQTAWIAFWEGVRDGRFDRLHDRNDLWRLLAAIIAHKVKDLRDYLFAARRGGGAVRGDSAFQSLADSGDGDGIEAAAVDPQPTPEAAALLLEAQQRLLDLLPSPEVRAVALWKLAGYTDAEVADKLPCSKRTVERRLALIRAAWEEAPMA